MVPIAVPDTVTSSDGVSLRVYDLGGDGPPLLLSHATGFCGQVWGPMAEALAAHFRCVAFDFRSHGRSGRPVGRELVWDGFADDVAAVAAAISPDAPIAAVGHSMGGAALAMAEVRRPGTLSAAWTYEPILFERTVDDAIEPSEIAEGARRRRAVFASRDEALARYRSRPPLSSLDPRALAAYVQHGFEDRPDGTVMLRCRPEDEASVFEHHNSGARHTIGEVRIPFLIAASGDGRRPAETVVEVAADFPHLELARYPSLSHFGPLEEPDRLAADVATWLSTGGSGGGGPAAR